MLLRRSFSHSGSGFHFFQRNKVGLAALLVFQHVILGRVVVHDALEGVGVVILAALHADHTHGHIGAVVGDTLRIVAQDKNSLAPEGAAIAFELHPEHGFQWKGFCDATVDNILNGTGQVQTKTMQMEDELRRFLTQPRPAEEVLALAKQLGISERTLKIAKRNLGILSERRADQWLWRLPEQEGKGVTP